MRFDNKYGEYSSKLPFLLLTSDLCFYDFVKISLFSPDREEPSPKLQGKCCTETLICYKTYYNYVYVQRTVYM